MYKRFLWILTVTGVLILMSAGTAGKAHAEDIPLGFKARISNGTLIVTGNGVAGESFRKPSEASQTAQMAAMIDALRNLGEAARAETERMSRPSKRKRAAYWEGQDARITQSFWPLYKTITTTCHTAGSMDGKFRYDRCTFDYGRYRLQSCTDMQNNVITADIMTFRTLEHTIGIVDFALSTPFCSDMVGILKAIIMELGMQSDIRQLPDGSAEVDLIYRPPSPKP